MFKWIGIIIKQLSMVSESFVFSHQTFDRLPIWVSTYIPEFIKGPENEAIIPKIDGKSFKGYETASFIDTDKKEAWTLLNDNVMGGRSKSHFSVQSDQNEKYIAFEGATNLDGGGFCSVQTNEFQAPYDLSSFAGICVSMKSAVKLNYGFHLSDDSSFGKV